jgi:hypothetical protein
MECPLLKINYVMQKLNLLTHIKSIYSSEFCVFAFVNTIDGIPQTFVFFRFVDIIVITVHDRFWNVGQANCILKYFEIMMIDLKIHYLLI